MPDPATKTPRLIRRGDVVFIKGTQQEEIVRGVSIVLHLANGISDSYDSGEVVHLGTDTDLSPADLIAAAGLDAAERAAKTVAGDAAVAASNATAQAAQAAAEAFSAAQEQVAQDQQATAPQEQVVDA